MIPHFLSINAKENLLIFAPQYFTTSASLWFEKHCPALKLTETSADSLSFRSSKALINDMCQFAGPCQNPEMALLFQYALHALGGTVFSEGTRVSVFV